MTRWILVVEDEPSLGEMLCDNLQSEGHGAELVRSGTAARDRIARGGLDLIILDIMLPGIDGFTVLEQMRTRGDDTPVLILSARIDDSDRIRGLELQADDYLTKPFNLKELLLRVEALLRRKTAIPPGSDVLEFSSNRIDFRSHRATTHDGEQVKLTPTEVKLLRLLSTRQGEVVPRKELAHHLFGPNTPATTRTLDNTILNLRRLFERDSKRPRHLLTVRGVGMRFTSEGES